MDAIVKIAGKQYKVVTGQELIVNKLDSKPGEKVNFNEVLLTDVQGNISLGTPYIKNATVSATVIEHLRDEKVIVFKKKRRKGYKVKNGHKQPLSKIIIEQISNN